MNNIYIFALSQDKSDLPITKIKAENIKFSSSSIDSPLRGTFHGHKVNFVTDLHAIVCCMSFHPNTKDFDEVIIRNEQGSVSLGTYSNAELIMNRLDSLMEKKKLQYTEDNIMNQLLFSSELSRLVTRKEVYFDSLDDVRFKAKNSIETVYRNFEFLDGKVKINDHFDSIKQGEVFKVTDANSEVSLKVKTEGDNENIKLCKNTFIIKDGRNFAIDMNMISLLIGSEAEKRQSVVRGGIKSVNCEVSC